MLRLGLTSFLTLLCVAQGSAQPLVFRSRPERAPLAASNAHLAEMGAQQALQTGVSNCRSPFGVKFLCGVGGMTLSSIVGVLLLQSNPEDNSGLTALAFLLASVGCAGGVTLSGNSFGDKGSFWASWIGSAAGFFVAIISPILLFYANPEALEIAVTVALVTLPPFGAIIGYDFSSCAPPQDEPEELYELPRRIKSGQLGLRAAPSVSASLQGYAPQFQVKLLQIQF